jgi:DNA-binding MarR family transcriptional regulator
MVIKRPSQEGRTELARRLMLALRRSSAAGVLHGQTIARRAGINSTDMECLDLIIMSGPSTAGEIGRRTGLSSGAITGLIDRLEKAGLVERAADPNDRRKVLVRVREDRIAPIASHFAPLEKRMQALLSSYNREALETLLDFTERSGEIVLERVAELNDAKTTKQVPAR